MKLKRYGLLRLKSLILAVLFLLPGLYSIAYAYESAEHLFEKSKKQSPERQVQVETPQVPKPVTPKEQELRPAESLRSFASMDEVPISNSDPLDVPARQVRILLNPVEEVSYYEVHVQPAKQRWSEQYRFVIPSSDNSVLFRLTPGQYFVRTRSLNDKKEPGAWGPKTEFWVRFKPPEKVYPAIGSEIEPMGADKEILTFEWPGIQKAQGYLFVLKDEQGQIIHKKSVQQTWIKVEIPTDASYSWTILPLSSAAESISEENLKKLQIKFNHFKIKPPAAGSRGTVFEIANVYRATHYEYEVVRIEKSLEPSAPSFFQSRDSRVQIRLAPGTYEMRARGHLDNDMKSDWSAPKRFTVQLYRPKPKWPRPNRIVESADDEESPVKLSWEKQEDADRYRVSVYSNDGQLLYTEVTIENFASVKLPHASSYRWFVEAYSPGERLRQAPPIPAETDVFEINKYKKLALTASEEPSQLYGWGKQISSLVSYEGESRDLNARIRQKIYGGMGELALGYWHRKSNLGLLSHVGLSGFTIVGKTSTYANAGLHIGYRHLIDELTRLRIWAGYSYGEFSEIKTQPFTNEISFEKIKTTGPQLQFSYLKDFNSKMGWQAYSIFYLPTSDQGSPNGLDVKYELSFSLGLLGTYRLSDNYKGMIGYTYKNEGISYLTDDPDGGFNRIRVSGHYLSFILEFGLQPKMK